MLERPSQPQSSRSLEAKIKRDDVEKYKASFLFRQRVINERIIGWYGSVGAGTSVFDACAGPEGSYLAVSRRGGSWVGNEISIKTAAHLKETGATTVVGSADQLPIKPESMDLVLYVFALNNIENTEGALSEAREVLKPGGSILISDPGQTMWATDLYLYAAIKEGLISDDIKTILENSERFKSEIPEYFVEHPERSGADYTDHPLVGMYGLDLQRAAQAANSLEHKNNIRKIRRGFHELMEGRYWAHTFEVATSLGLSLEKFGLISASQHFGKQDWDVGEVVDLAVPRSAEELAGVVVSIRNNTHPLSKTLVQAGAKIHQNIISPVVLFKKGQF